MSQQQGDCCPHKQAQGAPFSEWEGTAQAGCVSVGRVVCLSGPVSSSVN